MVAAVPGETAVMKRSAKGGGRRRGGRGEEVALVGGLAEIVVADLANGLGRVGDPRGGTAPKGQQLGVVGKLDQVARQRAPALAAEAAHAPGHVGGEAGPRLLAVVAHVDAHLALAGHHHPHRGVHLPLELARVDRLAAVLLHQEVAQGGVTGNAAHVGRQDPVVTLAHVVGLDYRTMPARRGTNSVISGNTMRIMRPITSASRYGQ